MSKLDKKLQKHIFDGLRTVETKYHLAKRDALKKVWVAPASFRCQICEDIIYFGDRDIEDVDYLGNFRINGNTVRKDKRECDHIESVIPLNGFKSGLELDWNEIIEERMFPNLNGYQVLCKTCHVQKSNIENAQRREFKKVKKKL